MLNDGANAGFEADEGPTQPGMPPRTATSRWRAVTSVALQRGIGRLSDGEFDEGNLDAASTVAAEAEAAEVPPAPPRPEPAPEEAAPSSIRERPVAKTVRMAPVSSTRGPTGTVRIPKRAAPAASATRDSTRMVGAVVLFGVIALAQLLFLAANQPPARAPLAAPAPSAVAVSSPPPPAAEVQATPVDTPAAIDTSPEPPATPAKAAPRWRARKATRAASNVF
jgi:hypothetical protein